MFPDFCWGNPKWLKCLVWSSFEKKTVPQCSDFEYWIMQPKIRIVKPGWMVSKTYFDRTLKVNHQKNGGSFWMMINLTIKNGVSTSGIYQNRCFVRSVWPRFSSQLNLHQKPAIGSWPSWTTGAPPNVYRRFFPQRFVVEIFLVPKLAVKSLWKIIESCSWLDSIHSGNCTWSGHGALEVDNNDSGGFYVSRWNFSKTPAGFWSLWCGKVL